MQLILIVEKHLKAFHTSEGVYRHFLLNVVCNVSVKPPPETWKGNKHKRILIELRHQRLTWMWKQDTSGDRTRDDEKRTSYFNYFHESVEKRRSCCRSIHVFPLYVVAPFRTSTLISQRTLADCHLLLFQHFSISPCSLCSRTFLCSSHLYLFSPITQFLPNSEPLEPDHSHKASTSKLRHDVLGMWKFIRCYRQTVLFFVWIFLK
jgi:hypothetical protein